MKKLLLLILFAQCAIFCQAQTPKIRIEKTVFSARYELGEKTTSEKDIAAHLKQHDTDAYIYWKAADKSEKNALIWTIAAAGGLLVGLLADENQTKLIGYSAGAVTGIIALGCTISSGNKRQKSIDTYNRKYGY